MNQRTVSQGVVTYCYDIQERDAKRLRSIGHEFDLDVAIYRLHTSGQLRVSVTGNAHQIIGILLRIDRYR